MSIGQVFLNETISVVGVTFAGDSLSCTSPQILDFFVMTDFGSANASARGCTNSCPRIVNCRLPAAAFGIRYGCVGLLPAFTFASHGVSLPQVTRSYKKYG